MLYHCNQELFMGKSIRNVFLFRLANYEDRGGIKSSSGHIGVLFKVKRWNQSPRNKQRMFFNRPFTQFALSSTQIWKS